MLLLASIVVVAGRWSTITPEVRFSGLIAVLTATFFTAEALRSRLAATSTALAALAATITAPVGIAAAATLDQPWPICVLVGGVGALAATEFQSRRWNVPVLEAATVIAAGLAVTGLAALIDVPAPVLGACAAVGFLGVAATRRSVAMSVAVGATPLLIALSDAGVGAGTLSRIGATGDQLAWSAPLSAAIAAVVIAITATRRRALPLAALSITTLAIGVLTGLGHADLEQFVWWCVPGALVIAVESFRLFDRRSVWSDGAAIVRPYITIPVTLGAALSPALTAAGLFAAELDDTVFDTRWAVASAVTAGACWMATASAAKRDDTPWSVAVSFSAAAAASLATVMAATASVTGWAEVTTLAAITVMTALVGRTRQALWLHAAAVMGVGVWIATLDMLDVSADVSTLTLMVAGAALTGVAFRRWQFGALDTAALFTTAAFVGVSSSASPAVTSLAVALAAAQLTMYAVVRRNMEFAAATGAVFTAALISLWWTSGANDIAIERIAPYGADGIDIAIGAAAIGLIGGGVLVRRMRTVTSWLAYGPGLSMAATWLLDSQFDVKSTWATVLALVLGVAATAVGALRRLGAPLLIGTAMIPATALISAGPRLAAAPSWIWIAGGGVALLALAAFIERSDRPIIGASADGEPTSIVQQFCHDFQ